MNWRRPMDFSRAEKLVMPCDAFGSRDQRGLWIWIVKGGGLDIWIGKTKVLILMLPIYKNVRDLWFQSLRLKNVSGSKVGGEFLLVMEARTVMWAGAEEPVLVVDHRPLEFSYLGGGIFKGFALKRAI
eukprot:Gb_03154 [translate_table: standard]